MPARIPPLSRRILSRLAAAEVQEPDPWLRDDLQIARLTVLYAALGEAVECAPQVLASYELLGLHPEKVWPAIQARRKALLGPLYGEVCGEGSGAPPKKPAQSVKLWCEQNNGARAVNSRAGDVSVLREPTISVLMAAPSIAALYPKSDVPSSAKARPFTYEEMLAIVEFSGAPHSVRQGTLSALKARGRWPHENGPATGVVCISLIGMQLHGVCCRSTARWRARRAVRLGYWRELRKANAWSDCPKCGIQRKSGTCKDCGYVGRAKTPEGKANFDEFCRPYMYEIDIDKFRRAQRPKELRHFDARTYAEYKEAAKRGEHPNVREMPRKPSQPAPPPQPPAPAAPLPQRKVAEHRSPQRQTNPTRKLTPREGPKLVNEMRRLMHGVKGHVGVDRLWIEYPPGDPRYREPMSQEDALKAACMNLAIPEQSAREFLKLLPRDLAESEQEQGP
jgi:hypothetical protein